MRNITYQTSNFQGGFLVDDPAFLTWEFRQEMIIREIRMFICIMNMLDRMFLRVQKCLLLGEAEPDIFCLQEANHTELLSTEFKEYTMNFAPKLNSAALGISNCPPDGCAIFVRRERYKRRHHSAVPY